MKVRIPTFFLLLARPLICAMADSVKHAPVIKKYELQCLKSTKTGLNDKYITHFSGCLESWIRLENSEFNVHMQRGPQRARKIKKSPGKKNSWNQINDFFQILLKSRCYILFNFPSHLKKLRSILRFWLEKLNCGFFHSFHSWKNTTKQLFLPKFQCRK